MSEKNPIRVFVTHSFAESDNYLRVFEFLECVDRFYYFNVSKPENMPKTGGMDAIKEELIAQIKQSEVVLVLAELYTDNRDLVRFQMDVAEANNLPTIAIRPFGGRIESPKELVDRAKDSVEWNDREIADTMRRLARLEDTSRWDVIDFPGFSADQDKNSQ